MTRAPRRRATAVAVLAAALVALPTTATAAAAPDGRWYIDALHLPEVHQTTRGEGVQVAVIDTAINPAVPDLVGTPLQVREPSFCDPVDGVPVPAAHTGPQAVHGSIMTALVLGTDAGANGSAGILGVAPGATVRFYSTNATGVPGSDDCPGASEGDALQEAIDDGADIVSMSFGSGGVGPEDVARALREGVILVGAAGNYGGQVNLPAAYNGVLAVAGAGADGTLLPSASGPRMGVVAPGADIRAYHEDGWQYSVASGSSQATAITSGAIALAMSRWPDATPNQILQSVVRNTGAEPHELAHDDTYGYGFLNLGRVLETDPTQYEDVNPLISEDTEYGPTPSQIVNGTGDGLLPDDESTGDEGEGTGADDEGGGADTPADDTSPGMSTLVVVGLGLLGLLLVAGVTVALVLAGRARRSRQGPVPPPPAPGHSTFDAANRGEHHG